MKAADFWMRYFDPVQYLRVNGQLPVEWETEVFEKFEKPYRRDGAGLSLAYQYLETDTPAKDSLLRLVQGGLDAVRSYRSSVASFAAMTLEGPVAWNGVLSFWVRNVAVALWLVVTTVIVSPSLTAIPADSWPRCCSAYSPKNASRATSLPGA